MKKYLIATLFSAAQLPLLAQNTYLSVDFSAGIPADFVLYDMDQKEPSADMAALGFAVGTPWTIQSEGEDNQVAASTSWYQKAGTSNDWMITSPITVADANAIFSWRARTSDSEYRDGYKVCISTTGSTVEDFTADPVFSIKKENYAWTERSISLADYVGQTIYIAIVNNTKDCAMLFVDDLFAGIPSCVTTTSDLDGGTLTRYGEVYLSGLLTAKEDISAFTVTLEMADQTISQTFEQSVSAGRSSRWTFTEPVLLERNTRLPYTLTVEAKGDKSITSGKVNVIAHKIVAEEVTGTWCGYCVRGIVAMEQMRQDHPDDYIGIAVHSGSTNWPDAMAFDPALYIDPLFANLAMTGYPHCTINRQKKYTGDPANIPTYYSQAKSDNAPKAAITLTASYDPATEQLTAHTETFFCTDEEIKDYRQVYVMVENNVTGKGIGYYQSNYYSGVSGMGNFSNWPSIVPDSLMVYPDVARAIYGTYDGLSDIYSGSASAGDIFSYDYVLDSIPTSIHLRENTELVVMLLNKNKVIVNADKISLAGIEDYVAGIQAITNDAETITTRIYSLDGTLLSDMPEHGIFLIEELTANGSRRLRKILK